METETTNFFSFFNKIFSETSHDKIMYLSLFVDSTDHNLKRIYKEAALKHNNKIMNDPHFYDAGFDLFLPRNDNTDDRLFYGEGSRFFGAGWVDDVPVPINKVNFKVKCCAKMYNHDNTFFYTPFYTYARSSMSKTPLRLANNQGIIDAGYRGSLIGMFDCIYTNNSNDKDHDWYIEEYSRMLQICAPGLIPIYVQIVDSFDDLGPSTSRGEGGFGSTGI